MERGGVNRKTLVLEEFITSSLPKKNGLHVWNSRTSQIRIEGVNAAWYLKEQLIHMKWFHMRYQNKCQPV